MSGQDFLKMIEETANLELMKQSEVGYTIYNNSIGKKYQVKKDAIKDSDWNNISSVLEGRDPIILDGITRIVGYYSKISNWNKSKIGELKDRRTGNYKVGHC
ncbi:MAG: hypothetical protein GY817_08720 [bacterium]|nr:hypothetical protein [bacterium]